MPCYKPITAFQPLEGGQISFREKKNHREIQIPCGMCIGCRLEKIDAWGFRCMAEASQHQHNQFVTLTYADEHLPVDECLKHRHWQLFAKKLRHKTGPFRYFMVGEYGERHNRPHYHALLFGLDLPDKRKCNSVYSNFDVYESKLLSDTWGKGFCTIGEVTMESARYCAGYMLKRYSAEVAEEKYKWVTRYGEMVQRPQPYGRMSLKPGIGSSWLNRYRTDVVNHGAVFDHQYRKPVPRYFRQLLEKIDAVAAETLEANIIERGIKHHKPQDNTRARLEVRERCKEAAIRFKKERFPNAL